jgi:HSP20 family protein
MSTRPNPDRVDTTRIAAEFRHGVLKLTLPKAEQAKPKQIQVQVGTAKSER